MDIATFVIGKETTEAELYAKMKEFRNVLTNGKSVAFVVRKVLWNMVIKSFIPTNIK